MSAWHHPEVHPASLAQERGETVSLDAGAGLAPSCPCCPVPPCRPRELLRGRQGGGEVEGRSEGAG